MSIKTPMNDCLYSPQISPGNANITPPSATGPSLILTPSVIFTYPYVSPTMTVTIDAPNFNNRNTIRINRITRNTRGGTLKTFRYNIWPKIEVLAIAIDRIDPTIVTNLKALIKASVGQQIGYRDHESRQWVGVILNPDSVISQEGPGCQYTISFNMDATLASGALN